MNNELPNANYVAPIVRPCRIEFMDGWWDVRTMDTRQAESSERANDTSRNATPIVRRVEVGPNEFVYREVM